jgi:hypothetical protein
MSSDPMAASLRRAELGLLSLAVAVDGLASLALRASEGPVKPQPGSTAPGSEARWMGLSIAVWTGTCGSGRSVRLFH